MIPLPLVPVVAFLGVFAFTRCSLGWGFVALFAVGYVSGVVRANYLGIYTTFLFDAALLGLYVGFFVGRPHESTRVFTTHAGQWIIGLIAWPALLTLIPVNDLLVQLVALRATVWFLPVLLVATRLRDSDLTTVARGLAVLNLVALAGGVYVYQFGVAALYPENAVTQIIYRSNDVAGYQFHRVPSTFLSAHGYGGTMLLSLPFLLGQLFGVRVAVPDRILAGVGVAAALGGVLLCAARQPAIQLVLVALLAWPVARFSPVFGLVGFVLITAGIAVGTTSERLQRVTTLADTEVVTDRIRGSASESFLELLARYPAGAGMGSSYGTSIPFFLADRAPKALGLENEYCRILIDQGLLGLGLWCGFLVWLLHRPPPNRPGVPWGTGVTVMYAVVFVTWATAFLGAGTLSAVPGSAMLLAQMGILCRVREVQVGGG